MSYPEPRYLAEGGEVSAALRRADHAPELSFPAAGQSAHYLATGATTGGDFGLYRWNMGPDPTGPAPHFHRTMSESFFVLEGTVKLYDGVRWRDGHPGDFLYVPPGGVHGFRNESGAPASTLILFTPGAPREAYFEGLAELARGDREMTAEQFRVFCDEHDNHYV
ncbi:MAG TPA: cupin domain-containing protein [Nocardioidaceae bacterium]|nr:cupin domain-containing protein [Nocardioidaceae bacterium]